MIKKGPNTETGKPVSPRRNEKTLTEGLARIAAKARVNRKERFNNLAHHVTVERVKDCLEKIPRASSPGVDGMTVELALKSVSWTLPRVLEDVHLRRYEAPAVRRVMIPKSDGKQRPLGVPTVVDRALQSATAEVMSAIYEQDFLPCSFGFRAGLGCHHALATVGAAVDRGMNQILEIDIRDFFGSLDHKWMMEFVAHRIGDRRILALIKGWLEANVLADGRWQTNEKGTPQGGSISPLLANLYLHYVLDLWFEKIIKRTLRGKAQLVRYCDDFVLLFSNGQDLREVKVLLATRLAQFGLAISETKSHTADLSRGAQGTGRHHISFLGFDVLYRKTKSREGWVIAYQTEKKRLLKALTKVRERLHGIMHEPLESQIGKLNTFLYGYYAYFGMAGNSRRLWVLHYFAERTWRRTLSSRSQKGALDWGQMRRILRKYKVATPIIRIPYPALDSYVRL